MLLKIARRELPPRTGTAFLKFARRRGDNAILGVAAVVTLDERGGCRQTRLVYLNAGDGPVDARQAAELLRGQLLTPEAFVAAANHAAEHEIAPTGNVHATPAYQRHLARVLTRRALAMAVERAQAGPQLASPA